MVVSSNDIINKAFVFILLCTGILGYGCLPETKPEKNKLVTSVNPIQTNDSTPVSLQDSIVNFGMELLGTPYKTAACSREGFDCSGFVFFVFKHFNIQVPRSSAAYKNFGIEIPIEEVQKGDVLLFLSPTRNVIGHIGIVSKANGSNSDFLHATSGKAMSVVITNLSNKGYTKRFVKAIRVIE